MLLKPVYGKWMDYRLATMLVATTIIAFLLYLYREYYSTPLASVFGCLSTVQNLASAEGVVVCKLHPFSITSEFHHVIGYDDFRVTAGPMTLSTNDVLELRRLLTDVGSYSLEEYACEPKYSYRATFVTPRDRIDMFLDVSCGMFEVYRNRTIVGGGTLKQNVYKRVHEILESEQSYPSF